MKRLTAILDTISIFFLTLLSLTLLVQLYWTQGDAYRWMERAGDWWIRRAGDWIRVDSWGILEIILFVLLAIVVGTVVHLLCLHEDAFAFLFVAYLWLVLALSMISGLPYKSTTWIIISTIESTPILSCLLIYMYWIRRRQCRAYFKACAWVYILTAWIFILKISRRFFQNLALSETSLPASFDEQFAFVQVVLFVSVSVYLTCRLITGVKMRDPAELSSE